MSEINDEFVKQLADKLVQVEKTVSTLSTNVSTGFTEVNDKLSEITSISFQEVTRQIDQLNDNLEDKFDDLKASVPTVQSFTDLVGKVEQIKGLEETHLETFRNLTAELTGQVVTISNNYTNIVTLLSEQISALNKLIANLNSTTDSYMSAIGEFKDSALAAQEITSALLDAQTNLSASITQVYNKVNELRSGLEKLTELSINFTKAIDRKFQAVDISEMIKNIGVSLAATKFTLSKEEERL